MLQQEHKTLSTCMHQILMYPTLFPSNFLAKPTTMFGNHKCFASPRYSEPETLTQYDYLARGWILGSVSEDVLANVHNLGSAKAVWEKLQSICISPVGLQEEKEVDRYAVAAAETIKNCEDEQILEEGTNAIEITVEQDTKMSYVMPLNLGNGHV
ncbi:hypothetical protein Hdeb2414_s0017g00505911 [Helianthus debilis subsp. tardiflorus]